MVNGIAPLSEISIGDRINQIGSFLGEEELKLATSVKPSVIEPMPEPIISETPVYPEFSPTAANAEMIDLLRQVVNNQEVERVEYNRSHALVDDSPVYDWLELSVPAGSLVTFTLTVPEGSRFFFNYFNITYRADTIYNITVDGVAEPPTTEPVTDWADHYNSVFSPPRICQRHVIITALNNGDATTTYGCFLNGFFRASTKIDKSYLGAR